MSSLVDGKPYVQPVLSSLHQWTLLAIFCIAQFMDCFLACALFPALSRMETELSIGPNEITWVFSAYGATFAGFLLISGRVSDIYSAKWTFIVGAFVIGIFSLGCGFVHSKIGLFILRAISGIGAAMTVPSALSLIVEWFPKPKEQGRAIATFGGFGALGSAVGIIIGGAFTQYTTWRWVFYFTCILCVPVSIIAILVVPPSAPRINKPSLKRLDLGGVFLITVSMILFIFAVTSGAASGWGTAKVIAPLIISIALAVAFFIFEARIDPHMASLPPSIWRYPNVPSLIAVILLPLAWWYSIYVQFFPIFEDVYHWSPLMSAVRFLPITGWATILAIFGSNYASRFIAYVDPKWTLFIALLFDIVASLLLPFADQRSRYWSLIFPALIIGTIGNMTIYTISNIAIFMNTPPHIAGIIGAVYNSSFQLGNSLGLAIITSITTSMNAKRKAAGLDVGFKGTSAGFWFLFACVIVQTIALLVFFKDRKKAANAAPVVDTISGGGAFDLEKGEAGSDPTAHGGTGRELGSFVEPDSTLASRVPSTSQASDGDRKSQEEQAGGA